MNKSLYRALVAHTLSKYDIFLFGFLSPIIKPLFFPGSELVANMALFASFAAGYLIRPFGAIYFSHMGDKVGRRIAFMRTILFVMFPTLIISFLPGYEYIGIAAPIILITARLVQGFGSGGEFSGIAVYSTEIVKENHGFIGGLVRSVGFLGTAVGTAIASFLTISWMPSWAWRISFVIGAIATIISFFLRKNMDETTQFKEIKEQNKIHKIPLITLIKTHKYRLLCMFLISSCAYVFLYYSTIYLNFLYSDKLSCTATHSLIISTYIMLLWMVTTPISGYIADKIGIYNLLTKVLLVSFIVAPIGFYLTFNHITYTKLLALQTILTILGGLFFGAVPAIFKKFFPVEIRCTGTSIGNTLAQAIVGSMTPFYTSLIIGLTNIDAMAGAMVVIACVFGIIGLNLGKNFLLTDDES